MVAFVFLGWIVNVFRKWDSPQKCILGNYEENCHLHAEEPEGTLPRELHWLKALKSRGMIHGFFISRKTVDSRLSKKYSNLKFVPMPGAALIRTPWGIVRFLQEFWLSFIKSISFL